MPIDEFILTPMISPYENMIKDVEARGISGAEVEELKTQYNRLLELGQEHSDIGAFTGACMQEDLYTKLSDSYSRALSSQAQQSTEDAANNYDDAALLKQTVDALKMAISELKRAKDEALEEAAKDPKANLAAESEFAMRYAAEHGIDMQGASAQDVENSVSSEIDATLAEKPAAYDNTAEVEALDSSSDIIPALEALIALGEEDGMTLPKFLTIQIEQGLDKAAEGAGATRDGLEYNLGWAKASAISPHHIMETEEKLKVFDELTEKQEFGVPNWTEFKWARQDVEYRNEPNKIKWAEITDRWNTLLDNLSYWALAHCSFAPYVEPWKMLPPSKKAEAILQDKDTYPGIFKERERLLEKYFGVQLKDIRNHETFQWAVQKNHLSYSEAYVSFLLDKIYPACIPCQHLSSELVQEKEAFYKEGREINPHGHWPVIRVQKYYDKKFGEGRYLSKFGQIPVPPSDAAPWKNEEPLL